MEAVLLSAKMPVALYLIEESRIHVLDKIAQRFRGIPGDSV
jgi:hypothetical protein